VCYARRTRLNIRRVSRRINIGHERSPTVPSEMASQPGERVAGALVRQARKRRWGGARGAGVWLLICTDNPRLRDSSPPRNAGNKNARGSGHVRFWRPQGGLNLINAAETVCWRRRLRDLRVLRSTLRESTVQKFPISGRATNR
jgi:hypothetical protein